MDIQGVINQIKEEISNMAPPPSANGMKDWGELLTGLQTLSQTVHAVPSGVSKNAHETKMMNELVQLLDNRDEAFDNVRDLANQSRSELNTQNQYQAQIDKMQQRVDEVQPDIAKKIQPALDKLKSATNDQRNGKTQFDNVTFARKFYKILDLISDRVDVAPLKPQQQEVTPPPVEKAPEPEMPKGGILTMSQAYRDNQRRGDPNRVAATTPFVTPKAEQPSVEPPKVDTPKSDPTQDLLKSLIKSVKSSGEDYESKINNRSSPEKGFRSIIYNMKGVDSADKIKMYKDLEQSLSNLAKTGLEGKELEGKINETLQNFSAQLERKPSKAISDMVNSLKDDVKNFKPDSPKSQTSLKS